jgi:hypothetical protein
VKLRRSLKRTVSSRSSPPRRSRRGSARHRFAEPALLALLEHDAVHESHREGQEKRGRREHQVQDETGFEQRARRDQVHAEHDEDEQPHRQRPSPRGEEPRDERQRDDQDDDDRPRRGHEEAPVQDGLDRVPEDLDPPHPAIARRRGGVLIDPRHREPHEDDLVPHPVGRERAVENVGQGNDAERPAAAGCGGGTEEVDEHRVPLGDGDRAARSIEHAAGRRAVDDPLAPGEAGHGNQRETGDLLLAGLQHER